MQRRLFLSAATLAASALAAAGAAAGVHQALAPRLPSAAFPARPIRLVIAFPAGGPTDGLVRILAANASAILGQPVLVDNRPGAGGTLPLKALQAAPADGYTLAQMPLGVYRSASPDGNPHGDADEEVVPVIHVSGYALGLSLSPDSPLMDWRQLDDWARTWLGELVYGPGSAPLTLDLIAEKLGQQLRQKLRDGAASLPGSMLDQADASDVPLKRRHDGEQALPSESGPSARKSLGVGLIQNEPLGIVARRGTPPAVLRRLHDAFEKAMAQPNFRRSPA